MSVRVEFLKDGRRAKVTDAIPFTIPIGRHRVVPEGFITDFASVPRFFWRLVPPWGRYLRAAVIHDYLYATGEISREKADALFRNIMDIDGVHWWRRQAIYWAVRGFGWMAWNEHRKRGCGG